MCAARAAGARIKSSSFPKRPLSPAWGFNAQSAIRGAVMPNQSTRYSRAIVAAFSIASLVSVGATSRNAMCVVASTTRKGLTEVLAESADVSIIATFDWVSAASISVWPG